MTAKCPKCHIEVNPLFITDGVYILDKDGNSTPKTYGCPYCEWIGPEYDLQYDYEDHEEEE